MQGWTRSHGEPLIRFRQIIHKDPPHGLQGLIGQQDAEWNFRFGMIMGNLQFSWIALTNVFF